jgi:N-acetylneuraminate synthase
LENIWIKRPGTGKIKAADFNKLVGKKAAKDIPNDTHLSWEEVAG